MKILRRSFTLIEVAIAMAAFMVGTLPMLGLLTATTKANADNKRKAMVSMLATRKMEDINVQTLTRTWVVNAGRADIRFLVNEGKTASDLKPDDEFPDLSYVVQMHELNIRGSYMAVVGIADERKDNILGNGATFSASHNGSIACSLTEDQLQRFQKGGFICVTDGVNATANDVIFSFKAASVTGITGLSNYRGQSKTGKVVFLENVFMAPIFMKNKLYDFDNSY